VSFRRVHDAPHVLVKVEHGPGDGSVRLVLWCEVCGEIVEWGSCRAPRRRVRAFAATHPATPHAL
jgi:hypothetical protein